MCQVSLVVKYNYHEGNNSRLPDFDVFFPLFLIFINIINGHMVNVKIGI